MIGIELKTLDRAPLRGGRRLIVGALVRVLLVLETDFRGRAVDFVARDRLDTTVEPADELFEVEILDVCGVRRPQGGEERVVQAGIDLRIRLGVQVRAEVVGSRRDLRSVRRD